MLFATLLTLASAALHAAWNLGAKTANDRALALWGVFTVGGLLGVPVLVVGGLPERAAWAPLIASALVHQGYCHGLVRAYDTGDFSLTYPLARGGGALVAALLGAALLGDRLPWAGWLAVAVVAAAIGSLVRPGAERAALAWAGFTAVNIGVYSVIDAVGARRSTGVGYTPALYLLVGLGLTVRLAATGRLGDVAARARTDGLRWLGGGAASLVAYLLVNVAVRHAPVGYVATLRESSIVLGAAAGWLLLAERLGRARTWSSIAMLCGFVLLVAAA